MGPSACLIVFEGRTLLSAVCPTKKSTRKKSMHYGSHPCWRLPGSNYAQLCVDNISYGNI